MKKAIYISACVAALISCEVKDLGTDIDVSGHTIFKVDMEDVTLKDTQIKNWAEGDMIGVFGSEQGNNVGFYLKEASEGVSVAEFYGPLVKGSLIRAYFPYEKALEAGTSGIPCALASLQEYSADATSLKHFMKYSTRAFAVLDDSQELHFMYPFGLLEVKIALDMPVNMSGASLLGSVPVSGVFEIDETCKPVATDLSQKSIDLDFGGKTVSSGTVDDTPAVFRFVLPPASYKSGDLHLAIKVVDGQDFTVRLSDVDVKRTDCSDFTVSSVVVGLSDIPGLEMEDGYFEKEQ